MGFIPDSTTIDEVLAAAEEGKDLFTLNALAECHKVGFDDPAFRDLVEDMLVDLVEGHDDRFRDAIAALLHKDADCRIDVVTAELMVAMGIDPATVCALASIDGSGCTIRLAADDEAILHVDAHDTPAYGHCLTRFQVAPGMRWDAYGRLRVDGLAATVRHGCSGRLLSEIISHPILDRYPMSIVEASTTADGATTILTLFGAPGVVEVDAMMRMRPTIGVLEPT